MTSKYAAATATGAPGETNTGPKPGGPYTLQWAQQVVAAGMLNEQAAKAMVDIMHACTECKHFKAQFAAEAVGLAVAEHGLRAAAHHIAQITNNRQALQDFIGSNGNTLASWADEKTQARRKRKQEQAAVARNEAKRAGSQLYPYQSTREKTGP